MGWYQTEMGNFKIYKFPSNLEDDDDIFSNKVEPDASFCVGDVGKSTHNQTWESISIQNAKFKFCI